jgi:murein DD-endopeptidase MepM/ murein hydrolase activator NlpD/endonuclease/exonuclease/phosphatase family metal-dependent hydrolase
MTTQQTTHFAGPLTIAAGIIVMIPGLFIILAGSGSEPPAICPTVVTPGSEQVGAELLTPDRMRVATQIVRAVRSYNPTTNKPHAAVVALAAARQESDLRNLDGGDRDSLGAFQQRPSQGWGTRWEILDVSYAATAFLRRLVQISGWESMPVTKAAAAVQRPAEQYRDRYQQWVPFAVELTSRLWATAANNDPLVPDGTDLPAGAATQDSATGPSDVVSSPLADVSGGSESCTQLALASTGAVVYPVPANLASTNRDNWGGHGAHWQSWHTGTDFSVPCGTPVLASTSGTLEIQAGPDWYGRWLVKIVTGPTSVATWYAHMRSLDVDDGQVVTAGQQIGEAGDLGNTSGCHLHFEVHLRNGPIFGPDNVDPTPWLAAYVGTHLGAGDGRSVRVATFNVLGYSHTTPGGESRNHTDGVTRMGWTVQLLNAAGAEVIGFQEFQPPQEAAFLRDTAGAYALYPASHGHGGSANVVAWRNDQWAAVAVDRIRVPYFHGTAVGMPYVLLQNRTSGQRLWVINVHNPADVRGPAQQWRDQAVRIEAALMNRLGADGTPVILTGDMNDRRFFFCAITLHAPVHSATGGTTGRGEGRDCRPPPDMGINWIMGTQHVQFTSYTATRHGLVRRASDHPLIYVDATIR